MIAKDWIQHLDMLPHPEGGYYKETYKSGELISRDGLPDRFSGSRSMGTAIYFLLEKDNFSAFHRLKADEVWHFYDGTQLLLHQIDAEGNYRSQALGKDLNEGEVPQAIVPAGTWFAAEVLDKSSFALVGCTMAPGFDFEDFEMPSREELQRKFPQQMELIGQFTRE